MMLRADLPAQGAVRSDEELVDAAQDDGDTDEGEKPWESGGHGLRNEQPAGLLKSPKQPSAQDIAMHNLTHSRTVTGALTVSLPGDPTLHIALERRRSGRFHWLSLTTVTCETARIRTWRLASW